MDAPLIINHIGSRCTVVSQGNNFLFLGRLTDYDPSTRTLAIENLGGDRAIWSDVFPNMAIKLQVKSNAGQNELILMDGIVDQAEKQSITVKVQSVVAKTESRNFFRQNVMRAGVVSAVNGVPTHHRCLILNISATGIAIQSPNPYEIGDQLSMTRQRFRDGGPTHNVTFEVARISPMEKRENLFGCRFIDLPNDEEDNLFRDIFALQAAELHNKRHI